MKKISVLGFFILVSSLVACYDGTANQKVSITSNYTVGIGNYDFTGKTISNTTTSYFNKTVTTNTYTGTATTASTSNVVITKIPYQIETSTFTFNADGTFTAVDKISYATGLNAGFAASSTLDSSSRVVSSVAYGCPSGLAVSHTNLDGQNVETYTFTGTWTQYYDADATGVETLAYKLKPQTRTDGINTISISTVAASAITYTSASTSYTYADDGDVDFDSFSYGWVSGTSNPVFSVTFGSILGGYLSSTDNYTVQ